MTTQSGEHVYTITEITRLLKSSIEGNPEFTSIWIKGEITRLTRHSSGHIYFTLKDQDAVISAVLFRHAGKNLSFRLEEGMNVLVFGSVSIFEKRGSYQFIITQVRLEGVGELLKRIEQLKKKLFEEGLFDPSRKQKLPFLPKRLGVVTSPTGAAVRDIIQVALRRFPNLEIVLAPAKVQGDDAEISIALAIAELNKKEYRVDLIICGRGGGSFEDLMPFNEEIVVRAFADSRVPIISAVGHQIDHPLSDEAADLAATTPSAAAELAVPVKKELEDEIGYLLAKAMAGLNSRLKEYHLRVKSILDLRVFRVPLEIVNSRALLLADLETRMLSSLKDAFNAGLRRFTGLPDLGILMKIRLNELAGRYKIASGILENLSPMETLKRGYSLVYDNTGKIIRNTGPVRQGDGVRVRMYDGSLDCTVNSKKQEALLGEENHEEE